MEKIEVVELINYMTIAEMVEFFDRQLELKQKENSESIWADLEDQEEDESCEL